MAVEDRIDVDLEELLTAVDPRFMPVPDPIDGRRAVGYALRRGKDEVFSVDVLSPLRGPDRSGIVSLPAPRPDAQHQRYLDFLLHQVVNCVALFGAGVPINVPDPARFALHKLIVAQIRQDDARGAAKARNDIQQAGALIEVLSRQRPDDLKDVWEELKSHGASWREMASRSFDQLPPNVRAALGDGR